MVLGIDIGGTAIKFGVVDDNYNIIKTYSIPTETDKGDKYLVNTIVQKAKEIKKEISFDRIGIGSPGTIDAKNGIVLSACNLPYKNTLIADMIEKELCVPTRIANDARCATAGELCAGVGQKYNNFIMITLGTGVGGGIVINKKLYMGIDGRAGEVGHMIIKCDGLPCPCGQIGCYEQYASVTALIRETKAAIENNPDSYLAQIGKNGVDGKTAFDAKRKGCSVASEVVRKYIDYIAVGILGFTRIFQPDCIVLGGAISNEGDNLLIPLKEKVTLPVEIHISELKNNAGIIGAAALAAQV